MAHRAFLHVGTPKSGTTYLQDLWWRHHDRLAERGLLLPGRGEPDHFRGASLVCGRAEVLERLDADGLATWDRLLEETAGWHGDVLISHELFAPATARQAAEALQGLGRTADEVHVVVTARDLVRQLPSDWQQNVKQGRSETLAEYWSLVRDDPGHPWWRFQDVPDLLDRWGQGLPPERTHVVVLPPRGDQPPAWLWTRTCELLGVDPEGLDVTTGTTNASLGLAQVELVRRVQAAIPDSEHGLVMRRVTRSVLAEQAVAGTGTDEPFVLPSEIRAWARERGTTMARSLAARGCDVVGDLDDLVAPSGETPGRTPEEVTDEEVADVAVQALAQLLLREGRRRRRAATRGGARGREG